VKRDITAPDKPIRHNAVQGTTVQLVRHRKNNAQKDFIVQTLLFFLGDVQQVYRAQLELEQITAACALEQPVQMIHLQRVYRVKFHPIQFIQIHLDANRLDARVIKNPMEQNNIVSTVHYQPGLFG
jgi:hypothetical protein